MDKQHIIHKLLNNPDITNEWITPSEYTLPLGPFNLDPCTSIYQKWHHASTNWTEKGLDKDWFGRVWLNPPYSENKLWLKKMAVHNNGIVLVPARTDTRWFQDFVFNKAKGILFLKGRIGFFGKENYSKSKCTFAPVFISYGKECFSILKEAHENMDLFAGYFISL